MKVLDVETGETGVRLVLTDWEMTYILRTLETQGPNALPDEVIERRSRLRVKIEKKLAWLRHLPKGQGPRN